MTLEGAFFNLLSNAANVTQKIGGRIYPVILPQDAVLPAVSYIVVSDKSVYSHNGETGAHLARVQVDAWSRVSYAEVVGVAEALALAVSGFRGMAGDEFILACHILDNAIAEYDISTGLWRRIVDLRVNYRT